MRYLCMLAILVIFLASTIGIVFAASDDDVLKFAKGVLTGSIFTENAVASIDGDTLLISARIREQSDLEVATIGFDLYNLASAASKVVRQYPGKFTQVGLTIYDYTGNHAVGRMNVAVN